MIKKAPYAPLFLELREGLGLTQKDMAKELGCSQGLISKIETGYQLPPLEVYIRAYRLALDRGIHSNFYNHFLGDQ